MTSKITNHSTLRVVARDEWNRIEKHLQEEENFKKDKMKKERDDSKGRDTSLDCVDLSPNYKENQHYEQTQAKAIPVLNTSKRETNGNSQHLLTSSNLNSSHLLLLEAVEHEVDGELDKEANLYDKEITVHPRRHLEPSLLTIDLEFDEDDTTRDVIPLNDNGQELPFLELLAYELEKYIEEVKGSK